MPDPENIAYLPILAMRRGLTVGTAVGGVLVVAAVVVTSGHPLAASVYAAFTALFWGVAMAALGRRQLQRMFADLPTADRPSEDRSARAFRHGVMRASLLCVVMTVFVLVIGDVLPGEDGGAGFASGFIPGAAVWLALGNRGLQALQSETGLALYTRVGARRFAWTRAQAAGALVGVPLRLASNQSDR